MRLVLDEQLTKEDGTPLRKYEVEDQPCRKTAVRAAFAIVVAQALFLLKQVFFPDADAAAGPYGAGKGVKPNAGDGPEQAGTAALTDEREQGEDANKPNEPGDLAKILKLSLGSSYIADAEPGPAPSAPAKTPPISFLMVPGNDNQTLYGARPGSAIDVPRDWVPTLSRNAGSELAPGASEPATDETGGGQGPTDENPADDGAGPTQPDTPIKDKPRVINRLPVVTAPIVFDSILQNQSVIIGLYDLLRNASDADGDVLKVVNVTALSASVQDNQNGTWTVTPALDETGEIVLSFGVSDGAGPVAQTAVIDIIPLSGRHIIGSGTSETILGTSQSDRIDADAGDDLVIAREGDDVIYAGAGHDRIVAGSGNDVVYAGDGDDVVFGGEGDDVLFGEDGRDVLFGEAGNDTAFGGDDDDILSGGDGNDVLSGGDGNDALAGDADNDRLFGDAGDDRLDGGSGDDVLVGGDGADALAGGEGNDTFIAFAGDGDDIVDGGMGMDTYDASSASASVLIDLLANRAFGIEIGEDRLGGIENASGGSGNDTLVASLDVNVLVGGEGNDVFVFQSVAAAGNGPGSRDRILDFEVGDRIDLDKIDREFAEAMEDTLEDRGIRKFILIREGEAFTEPGQLRFKYEDLEGSQVTVIEGNIDFDAATEFEIEVAGQYAFSTSDFQWHA